MRRIGGYTWWFGTEFASLRANGGRVEEVTAYESSIVTQVVLEV